jgi:cellulose synthase (UDP-forming)
MSVEKGTKATSSWAKRIVDMLPRFSPLALQKLGSRGSLTAQFQQTRQLLDKKLSNIQQENLVYWGWISLIFLLLYSSTISVDVSAQVTLSVIIISVMMVVRKFERQGVYKTFFLLLSAYLSLRYFFWRTFETILFVDPISFVAALMLYFAELYGITIHLVSMFVNAELLGRKPLPLMGDPEDWPSVDIMVPSYNEEADILEVTLLAATQIRYPEDKLRVYLLDDGGTIQKRNDSNAEKAEQARQRYETLRALCAHVGAGYVTRERNLHAKAGNINSALKQTSGDLVLILDADHVPTADILEKTVGWFQKDPKLFLLQTPHFFINPDPIERNLNTFNQMPSENEMFYRVIQKGLDFWDASFFCGSAAILRRKYLMEIGGISGDSITEDAETALELHSRGYRSAYIDYPMIAGLQPETFSGFVVQRTRWTQGMVQIFLLKNPFLKKGLSWPQRIGYFNSAFFWFFSYSRMVFLFAPAAYLFLGLQIYFTNFMQFLGYALPHLIGALLTQNYLFSHVRWAIVSELYELMQAVFGLPGIIRVFLSPRSPSFAVTPKGEQLTNDFISPLFFRFYLLFLLNVACVIMAVFRYDQLPQERGAVIITGAWAFFNILLTYASLGVVREKRQTRVKPRMPVAMSARVITDAHEIPCKILDVSVDGAKVEVSTAYAKETEELKTAVIKVILPLSKVDCEIKFDVRHRKAVPGAIIMGLQFHPQASTIRSDVVELMHGVSDRWNEFLLTRGRPAGIGQGLMFFLRISLRNGTDHFWVVFSIAYYWLQEFLGEKSAIFKIKMQERWLSAKRFFLIP